MVSQPGTFPVTDVPVRIVEALGLAGGLLPEADLFDVSLSRDEKHSISRYKILYEGNLTGNALLRSGDVLHIAPNELRRIFIMGEV